MLASESLRTVPSAALGSAQQVAVIADEGAERQHRAAAQSDRLVFRDAQSDFSVRVSIMEFQKSIEDATTSLAALAAIDVTKLYTLAPDDVPMPHGSYEITPEMARLSIESTRAALTILDGETARTALETAKVFAPGVAGKFAAAHGGAIAVMREVMKFLATALEDNADAGDEGFDLIGENPDVGSQPGVDLDDL